MKLSNEESKFKKDIHQNLNNTTMPNKLDNAYGLTIMSPLKPIDASGESVKLKLREKLFELNNLVNSPLSKVPNTYLARFYILEDVFFENYPHKEEYLKSAYLVFTSNFHGDLDPYLEGMYKAISEDVHAIWEDGYGFDKDNMNVESFKKYIKKCQVDTTFFFNGSNDDSLDKQLKALYLKQEFSKFVFENAHKGATELQDSFKEFLKVSKPNDALPTWHAGVETLEDIIRTN